MPDAKAIFLDILALPAADRPAAVAARCGPDAALAARVNALLAADAAAAAEDATHAHATAAHTPSPEPAVGTLVGGRYKLLERIGEGGMGSVWMADQTVPVKRTVALKLIKPGMDSKAVLARFEAERQALALMDHPNIARVLDGGLTADGRPFFVMELVKGTPITDFCDHRRLTPRQRLELFVPVCQAVQHAHQKGVIHRDLKPSNVLVALYDDRPVPKVIDFGLAKATGSALTELTLHTAFGAVLGTPAYMSPEQASFNNLDIDTRTDVYSLGVLLYELLTGTTPVDKESVARAAVLEVLRLVREVDAPRPSVRLSTAAALPSIAANRGTEPARLGKLLRGELDWVVMKSLEKDRGRRYESATAFAADVQRYLSGDAVQAVPPTAGYRLRKFVRAHKGQVLAGGAVTTALVGGLAGTTWQAIRAEAEADRVRAEQARTRDALAIAERNQTAAERFLTQSFLRPLGYKTSIEEYEEAEVYALDEVAQLSDVRLQPSTVSGDARGDMVARAEGTEDRLKLLCLTEALADPDTALRTARTAERFIQAVVGTSPERRRRAIEIVTARQTDQTADTRVRLAACWFALALGAADLPALSDACGYIQRTQQSDGGKLLLPLFRHPLTADQTAAAVEVLGDLLSTAGGYYGPSLMSILARSLDGASLIRLTAAYVDRLDRAADETQRVVALRALSQLCDRPDWLPRELVDRALAAVAATVGRAGGKYDATDLAVRLARHTTRLDPAAAERVARAVVADATLRGRHHSHSHAPDQLRAVVPVLAADVRAGLAAELAAAADLAAGGDQVDDEHLVAVALAALDVLDPGRVPAVAAAAAAKAQAVIAGNPGRKVKEEAWGGLEAAARWPVPAARRAAAAAFLASDWPTEDYEAFVRGCRAIARAAPDLDAATRRAVADRLTGLVNVRSRGQNDHYRPALVALETVDPATARRVVLEKIVSGAKDDLVDQNHVRRLCGPAARAEPAAAAECDRILAALETVAASDADFDRARRVFPLLVSLDPVRAAAACPKLVARARDEVARRPENVNLLDIFKDAAPILGPDDVRAVAEVCAAVVRVATPDVDFEDPSAVVLALAPRLDAAAAERLAGVWPLVLNQWFEMLTTPPPKVIDAAVAIADAAPPAAAARLRTAVTDRLFGMLGRTTDSTSHYGYLDAIRRLDPARYAAVRDAETRRGVHLLFDTYTPRSDLTAPAETIAVLAAVSDGRFLAAFLSHPRCVEPLRRPLLDRLEEVLARPRSTPAVAAAFALSVGGPLAVGLDAAAWQRTRVFRTQWDAAAYLARHHPEFPLGRPPRPTPRK